MIQLRSLVFTIAGCLLAANAYAGTVNILAFGQSNMVGRFGPAPEYTGPDPNIRVWNWKAHKFQTAELGGFPFWPDRNGSGPANNLAYVFAQNMERACDAKINLTYLASEGVKIEYFLPIADLKANGWANHEKRMYFGTSLADEILGANGAARQALNAASVSSYDVVLIHQGEANSLAKGDTADVYGKKMRTMIDELSKRGFTSRNTEYILGAINPIYPKAAEQKAALLTLQAPNVGVVNWDGIETFHTPGEVGDHHATGNGLKTLGDRYFHRYMNLMGGNCPGAEPVKTAIQ